jgi:GNAT superfamily N-acetyltransferase
LDRDATWDISIEPVTTAAERSEFVRLPWRIYHDDPNWVAPLIVERKEFIDPRRHPFYRHGAAIQLLARREGKVIGRIQASDDPHYNQLHGTNVGCFGLFECIDDVATAKTLIDAASAWVAERGRDEIMGPIDYSTNYACGLLIDGFDTPPRVMMNHSPRYYVKLIEACGLLKAKDLYCWRFADPSNLANLWRAKAERLNTRGSITIRGLDVRDLAGEMERVKAIYNTAWDSSWGFVKLSDAELQHFAKLLRQIADPQLFLMAEIRGVPAGICLTLPDVNEALRAIDGRLTRWGLPLGYLKLRARMKQIRSCRLFALGVNKAYRRRGVAELLILRTLDYGKHVSGYVEAELSWTLEDNGAINRTIEVVGGVRYKTYRIYAKAVRQSCEHLH